jgi:hypothetical protein
MKQSADQEKHVTETNETAMQSAMKMKPAAKEAARVSYDPNRLLDTLMQHLGIHNDGALSRRLKIATEVIGNIRKGSVPVCASMLLWMQEATGIDVAELRRLMGDRRMKYRLHISIQQRPAPA